MNVIDMHCHILTGVDDGAKDIETSLSMLEASRDQRVQCMGCDSIFLCYKRSLGCFLGQAQGSMGSS